MNSSNIFLPTVLELGFTEEESLRISSAVDLFCVEYIWQHGYARTTANNYRWAVNSFIKVCGDLEIKKITHENVFEWRRALESKHCEPNAINSFLYRLRSLLRYYDKTLKLSIRPDEIIIPKHSHTIPKFLTKDQIDKLIEVSDGREKAIISVMYASGVRVGELTQLKIKDVIGDMIKVQGKGRIERIAFLDERAIRHLKTYLSTRDDSCQFLFRSYRNGGLSVSQIQGLIRIAGQEAELDTNVTPHMLRHSFATHLAQAGCGAFHLQKMLGHAHISTTQIYVHLGGEDIKSAYKKYHQEH